MTQPVQHRIDAARVPISYWDWGADNDPRPVLLLVHGGRDHARSWDWTAAAMQSRCRVVAMDLRGHGDSDWIADGAYLATDMVGDVVALIRHLGGGPVDLVGHSFGGNISLRVAALYPELVRKLVVIEGLGYSPERQAEIEKTPYPQRLREWIEARGKALARTPKRYATLEEATARMHAANPALSAAQAAHLTEWAVRQHPDGLGWKFDPALYAWPPHDPDRIAWEAQLATIACPTLLLYGTASWASNPAKDSRLAPFRDARLTMVEGGGHWLHHDRFDAFITSLRDFL